MIEKLIPSSKEVELGRAIAGMYCATQGVSLVVSEAALTAMNGATLAMRIGFDQVMERSPYQVKSLGDL